MLPVIIHNSSNQKKIAFYLAVEKENIEIIKFLLMNEKLDANSCK